jgi:hypothetical protein
VLESKDLLVDEAVLTGEAFPVEKESGVVAEQAPLALRTNRLLLSSIGVGCPDALASVQPLADPLGLTSPSPVLLLAPAGITAAYVVSSECAKRVFYRRRTTGA